MIPMVGKATWWDLWWDQRHGDHVSVMGRLGIEPRTY